MKHDRDTNVTSERYFRVSIHQGDLSKPETCVKLYEEVRKEHGRPVDILVSNAGYGKRITDIWDISVEEFEYTLRINLTASFVLTKCVVDEMKNQHWGRIIYVSSIAAYGAGLNGCRTSQHRQVCCYCLLTIYRLCRFERWPNKHDEESVFETRSIWHLGQRCRTSDDSRNWYDSRCISLPRPQRVHPGWASWLR